MNNPLISVIVPVYNSEKYLDKCIQSILSQTLHEIEIILVDDASPDHSIDIIQKYAEMDERVVVVRNKQNGHPNSRNAGIMVAKAEYLGFVDADDWIRPDMYEKLYAATENGINDVVIGEYNWVYPDGRVVRDSNIADKFVTGYVSDTIQGLAMYGGRLFTNLWKKKLITDDNLLFMENNYYCDSIVTVWYMNAKYIAKVSEPFYNYRINTISVTAKKDFMRFFDRLESSKYMLKKIKDIGLYEKYKDESDFLFYKWFYLNTIIGCIKYFTRTPYDRINEVKAEFKMNVDINQNNYYRQVRWKKWHLLVRIVGLNTLFGCIIAKTVNHLYHVKK